MKYIVEYRLYNNTRVLSDRKTGDVVGLVKGPWLRVHKTFVDRVGADSAAGAMTSHHRDLADVRVRRAKGKATEAATSHGRMRQVLRALLDRCRGVHLTDQKTGRTFADLIGEALR